MQILCKLYNFDFSGLPPPPPPTPEYSPPAVEKSLPYTTGVMMAHKYINEMADINKPPPVTDERFPAAIPPTKIVPGWNDGSNGWRARVYSVSSETSYSRSSYDDVSSISRRSPSSSSPQSSSSYDQRSSSLQRSETQNLLSKYSASFNRRAESAPSRSFRDATSPPKRERPFLPSGAEGQLLVPDVMLRVQGSSSSLAPSSSSSPNLRGSRPTVRSPLASSCMSEPDAPMHQKVPSTEKSKRPTTERKSLALCFYEPISYHLCLVRSWSYDNMPTYAIMPWPQGYHGSTKKLFNFAGKPAS